MKHLFNKQTLAWALYDWANSAYATIVIAVLFQILFADYWYASTGSENSTTPLGIANSISSLVIVILAPVLGAIADRGGLKKRMLTVFALLGILATISLYFIGQELWLLALAVYVLSGIGFAGGNIFYDAMIVNVAQRSKYDVVSGFGFALGYLSGGIALIISGYIQSHYEAFGLASQQQAQLAAFVLVGIWWTVFTVPLWLWIEEKRAPQPVRPGRAVREGFAQLRHTFNEIRKLRIVFIFLIAYWLYIDGVDTIIRMAMDYGKRLNFEDTDLIMAFLITQFVGFPAALLYGKFGERIGTKRALLVGIAVYTFITIYGYFMDTIAEFYVLATIVGLVQGGVQSLSRSLYAKIIPASKSGEFFGFYNMLGKFAAVIGPLMMGLVAYYTESPRWAILSVIVLFVAGGALLMMVDDKEGARIAEEMDRKAQRE